MVKNKTIQPRVRIMVRFGVVAPAVVAVVVVVAGVGSSVRNPSIRRRIRDCSFSTRRSKQLNPSKRQ